MFIDYKLRSDSIVLQAFMPGPGDKFRLVFYQTFYGRLRITLKVLIYA